MEQDKFAADELPSILESILFVHGEPLALNRLTALTGASEIDVRAALEALAKSCNGRGLVLIQANGAYQLGSSPVHASYVEKLMKGEFGEELSRAALETLAIIIYTGPLTRSEIEYMRGVNSSFILRALLLRGLIERIENPKDARSVLYRMTGEVLKHFGISKIEDLPRYQELKQEIHAAIPGA